MYATVDDIVKLLENEIPVDAAEEWDNVGLMLGRRNGCVKNIILALDFTEDVLEQALAKKAEFILTHHPAIFKKLASVTDGDWQQELLLRAAEHGIAVYSAHTNLDSVGNGVNYSLSKNLKLTDVDVLDDTSGIGVIGTLKAKNLDVLAAYVKQVLQAPYVIVGNAGKKVERVAVCGGSGSEFIRQALAKGADTFVTGDVKYHDAQRAIFNGLNIIDAGHQATEFPVLDDLADRLSECFSGRGWNVNVFVSKEAYLLRSI